MSFKLYEDSGYLNYPAIVGLKLPFNFIVGGRGTGKTYGALKYEIEHWHSPFMLMRRRQAQMEIISTKEQSPFKVLNNDLGTNIQPQKIGKYSSAFYNVQSDDGKLDNGQIPICYTCALSTISNMRGFDASDCKRLLYDEFIREPHEMPIKHEADAFLNAYETINRNRELQGKDPLQVVALSNASDLGNPIFAALGLTNVAERMKAKKQTVYINPERGITLFLLDDSPISEAKRKTAIYKALPPDSRFTQMAIDNSFGETDVNIESRPLSEYIPVAILRGDIPLCVYKAREGGQYYITSHSSGTCAEYAATPQGLKKFRDDFRFLFRAAIARKVFFEDYLIFSRFYEVFPLTK